MAERSAQWWVEGLAVELVERLAERWAVELGSSWVVKSAVRLAEG